MPVSVDVFLKAYQQALDEGVAALFVGAGMSVPAGFVAWKELLRDIAEELDLDIDEESDLIALAQYHVNHRGGRDAINRKIMHEYTKDSELTENHRLIARLPIDTVWTTNYDRLLEDAYAEQQKRVDRKIRRQDLARTLPKRDVVLYKMHGDVESPDDAVLTKDDYERYNDPQRRHLFTVQLQADLVSKTFMFLGLSFTDPNIDYILGRVRSLVGENRRDHYWVTRSADADPKATKRDRTLQKHRVADLKTYGIQTVFIDDHGQITNLLRALLRRSNRKNVFLSGSAHRFDPFTQESATTFLRALGRDVIGAGFNVVCGMGLGVGDAFAMGAIEAVFRGRKTHLDERVLLRPFPQLESDPKKRKALWTGYREDMLQRAGISVFVFGNKIEDGIVVDASGVREEFEIAERRGVYPVPVGATGYASKAIAAAVLGQLPRYFDGHAEAARPHLERLCEEGISGDELVKRVVAVLKILTPS